MFPKELQRSRSSGRVPRKDYSRLARLGLEFSEQAYFESGTTTGKEVGVLEDVCKSTIKEDSEGITNQVKRKPKRKRVLVDHNSVATAEPEPDNEYERQRQERIKRNAEFIHQLGLKRLVSELTNSLQSQNGSRGLQRAASRPRKRPAVEPTEPLVVRKSSRQRGLAPENGNTIEEGVNPKQEAGHEELMELEEYFKWKGESVEGHRVSGHFKGWVNSELCQQYGIAGSADEAWESNGGGKFSFKIDRKAIPAEMRSKGWSDARAFAATQLRKNPNAYFYRHVAPHEQQAQGEWTDEEHNLFLETAKKYGAGDKWGLFSSYIPQRVGYQCSAYYREIIVPQGWIFDPKFRLSRNGRAIYVG